MNISILHRKRVMYAVVLTLLLSSVGITNNVLAYDFTAVSPTGQTLYYTITNPTNHYVQVAHGGVNYIRPTGNLIIPSGVTYNSNNYSVTSIGDFAFQNSSNLTMVTIPNSVTSIGEYAFNGCSGLVSIVIPNSVTSIGDRALSGCSGLTSINIPNSVTSIGDFAFIGCNGLTSLTIPSSVTIIGESPCCHCTQIETIIVESGNPVYDSRNNCNAIIKTSNNVLITGCKSTIIPNTVTTIGTAAFEGCTGLSGLLYIPNSVVTIGGSAFRDCSGLTGSLVIPNSVVSIGNAAFYGCDGLNGTLSIPNSVTSIGEWAFSSCRLTGTLTIPNSVTLIGDYAFYGCTFSGNLVIPNSLTSIGNSTFLCCRNLTSLYIPNTVVSIGGNAFGSCEGLTGSLSIPNSVLSIGDGAFSSCSGLTGSLFIPNSVISIGDNPFRGTGIESISVASDNPIYDSRNNCNAIINTNSNELITGCSSTIIPNTVTSIADNAFTGATGLLVIPNSVTTIGNGAFQGCNKITTVVLGNSVTSIGANAFGWCRDINSMMVLSDTPPMLGAGTFYFVPTNIPVAVPCGTVGVYQATTGWESFSDLKEMCSSGIINCSATPSEGGVVTGGGMYETGSLCTIQAIPNDDYLFVNWSKNGEVVSVFPSYSFAVTEDANYEAVFIPRSGVIVGTGEVLDDGWLPSYSLYNYSLSQQIYTKNELGNAQNITSISFYNAGFENTRNYDIYLVHTEKTRFNNKMDWIAVNETNKVFSGNVTLEKGYWTTIELDTPFAYNGTSNLALIVDDNTGSWDYDLVRCRTFNTNEQQAIMVYSDQINYNASSTSSYYATALFSSKNQIIFNINTSERYINAMPNPTEGGSITGAGVYELNTTCTLTATANEGYTFTNWTENGEEVSTNASYSFRVTSDRNLVANFSSDENHWNVDIFQYPYNMSVTGIIQIYGEEQSSSFLEIGAFCGDECRGSQRLTYFPQVNRYLVFFTLYGNAGDVMSFRLYDHALGQELDLSCSSTITFVSDGFMGTPFDPYVFDFNMTVDQISYFSQGYNWWCSYIEQSDIDGLGMLQEGLGSNGTTIRSQASGYTDFYPSYGWYGSLTSINNESSYRVITNAACSVTMTGSLAVPSEHPIILSQGWNWIGYVPSTAMSVDAAMSGLNAVSGDKLKSQQGYADYYDGYGWFGSLNTIEPGMGLMYYSSNNNPVTFTYPDTNRGGELKKNLTAENNHWEPNPHAYPTNMTLLAVIDVDGEEIQSEDYELAVFDANGECRGSITTMYVDITGRYYAFLTIYGDVPVDLHFGLYDGETNEECFDVEEMLMFNADASIGTIFEPMVLHFHGLNSVNELDSRIKVFPNPVNRGEQFSIDLTGDVTDFVRVEIINTLGVVETVTPSRQTLTAPNVAGVYTLRIIVEGKETVVRKLVVK